MKIVHSPCPDILLAMSSAMKQAEGVATPRNDVIYPKEERKTAGKTRETVISAI